LNQSAYFFDSDGAFVVEQYNDQAPFASFLPGIAGVSGRPAWAFYVNRGQAIASFGVRNKDGAFLEFFPADKAYQLTASRGFRTFLKIGDGSAAIGHEPFQRNAGADVRQRLYVSEHEVGVEESHPRLGLRIRADMSTLPEAAVAGLMRRVEITNTSPVGLSIEVVDGLPQVLPYAMNQWILKFMSRTSEAFMRVEEAASRVAFYRLRVWPTDSPQVEPVVAGNFFAGFRDGVLNPVIVDPERVFGLAGDFAKAERFFSDSALDLDRQVAGNRTPSAFQTLRLDVPPGASRVFYGVYGHAVSPEVCLSFVAEAAEAGYFEAKREANRRLLDRIGQKAFTATAKPLFDTHVRQCYLDNGLRGGFPTPVPGGALLYLFGRKHGDLERDYNDFLLQDTPYSEGNGDFRDVLQNRRIDLFFEPALGARNIRYFFNLIQSDGYNPCALRNSRFVVDAPERLTERLSSLPSVAALLATEFKYAELWQALSEAGADVEDLIAAILAEAREVEDAEFDRGYWSDHWTYLVDLLIAYRAIFPERLTDLLLETGYSFFEASHFVAPRTQNSVLTAHGVRQYGAVQFSADKQAIIAARAADKHRVRDRHGLGEVVYTSLLGKILTLVANKLATLDPAGIGIEMEADRPGWCDALNGLPGIFGSAVNETIELLRLVDFTRLALDSPDGSCDLPMELAEFIAGLQRLLAEPEPSAERFWRDSGDLKEGYRARVFMGFAGELRTVGLAELREFLAEASRHLTAAIEKARMPQGIHTYYSYEVSDYRALEGDKVEVLGFEQHTLPLFLEGFVHALRIAGPDEARRLYQAARASALFDRKLGMYRLNAPLGNDALALGRIGVFNDGWLENGSIFLHMHYKFVLEMLRAGLVDEFYADLEKLLVAFRDPAEYQRSPIENSSFLVSSGFDVDPRQHGRGCVARLSGSTVELLHLWTHLFLGPQPFAYQDGELSFAPAPLLAGTMFAADSRTVSPFGYDDILPADSAAMVLFGSTLLVYINPSRRDSFGISAVQPLRYRLYDGNRGSRIVEGGSLPAGMAQALRDGQFRRVDVELG